MKKYDFIFADTRQYRVLRHIAFWLCWILFASAVQLTGPELSSLDWSAENIISTRQDPDQAITANRFLLYNRLLPCSPIHSCKEIPAVFFVVPVAIAAFICWLIPDI